MTEQKISDEQLRAIKRLNKRIYGHEDSAPDEETKNIYKCFTGILSFLDLLKGLANFSVGYFLLSAQRLYFMVDYPYSTDNRGNHFSFVSTSIRNIGTVCASYDKPLNVVAFIFGCFFALFSLIMSIVMFAIGGELWWLGFVSLIILGGFGAFLIYGAFTFLRARNYKITIGDITIMGGTAGHRKKTASLNGNNTIIYNAIPIEKDFYEFVEVINGRIATLQERGDYA